MDIRKIPVDAINPAFYNPRIDLQPEQGVKEVEISVVDRLMDGKGGETNWHRRNPDDLRS